MANVDIVSSSAFLGLFSVLKNFVLDLSYKHFHETVFVIENLEEGLVFEVGQEGGVRDVLWFFLGVKDRLDFFDFQDVHSAVVSEEVLVVRLGLRGQHECAFFVLSEKR